jgi:CRP/FNR family transcriptional regulator, cyclic AMP receptor protein
MTSPAIVQTLARSPLFGTLDEVERKAVADEMRPTAFAAGQVIFSRGDPGREIFVVTEGRVRISVLTVEGRELSFWHAEPGSVFGEIAALDGGPRTADATAVTVVKAQTLSQAALKRLMEKKPAVAEAAIALLCSRLREADQQLEAIALHPIEVRLARFFLAQARVKAPNQREGKVDIDLGMSQSELALLIGASRPKVNAALIALEDTGAISRKGTALCCALDALIHVASLD